MKNRLKILTKIINHVNYSHYTLYNSNSKEKNKKDAQFYTTSTFHEPD